MAKMDIAFFPSVEGSMTSEDGQTFLLHVKRPTGGDLLLGFPHDEVQRIIEHASVQSANAKDDQGRQLVGAFNTSSFKVSRAPDGVGVLTMVVGQGGAINFLLPDDMAGQLSALLQKLAN